MTTLSYSLTQPALRSPVEEWQPHDKQSESTHRVVVSNSASARYSRKSLLSGLVSVPLHRREGQSGVRGPCRATRGRPPHSSDSQTTAITSVSVISRQQR